MSILTPLARLSYAKLSVPTAHKDALPAADGTPPAKKYSTIFLIPKETPKAELDALVAAHTAVKNKAFPDGCKYGATGTTAFIDGAERYPQDPAMHGFFILSASAQESNKPVLVREELDPVTKTPIMENGQIKLVAANPSEVYSGCWGVGVIRPYAYFKGKSGIVWNIDAFKKTRDDESLGAALFDAQSELSSLGLGSFSQSTTPLSTPPTAQRATPPTPPTAPPISNGYDMGFDDDIPF